jgi:tellurite resistance protein TerC
MIDNVWLWVGFNVFILTMLALDLGVFNRKAHAPTFKESALWTMTWVSLAIIFAVGVYFFRSPQSALEFSTGYLIEYSLSVDNIFVFVLLFTYFRVPAAYQHRVLFWGVLGALIMRGTLILVGAALLDQFHWIIYVFGAFLIFTGIRMGLSKEEEEVHPEGNPLVRVLRRFLPVTTEYEGNRFFIRRAGKLFATPLFVVLLIVESTDLVFAVDSIPAIFAVTRDPFIVYTSNVFAILGLRSLYFLLAGVIDKFYYLRYGLAVILSFVGVKMLTPAISELLIHEELHIPTQYSLMVIIGVLIIAIIASWLRARRIGDQEAAAEHTLAEQSKKSQELV